MKNCTILITLIFSQIFLFAVATFADPNIDPNTILQKVDEIRCPTEDFSLVATVSSYKANQAKQTAIYEIRMQGREKSMVRTLQPASERGRVILMRDNDYWFFFPEVSQPLRISPSERFLGDVANGDIARINFYNDYTAQLLREEVLNGRNFFVLELNAKDNKSTYGKIILWVEQENSWPLKAELYAVSGRLLKTCSYENYKMLAGIMRPSRLVFTDVITEGQYSVIEYSKIEVGQIADKYFSRDYLKKMVF